MTARKRVLVLGGGGMLGHKLFQVLQEGCDTYATFRQFDARLRMTGVFDLARVIDGVDAWDMTSVRRSISEIRPDWVVNCIGVIKQLEEARDAKVSIYVNALFPHLLGQCSRDAGVRMIHLSTDCVFSGKKGDYVEEDPSDADDLYGKTKYLGEVSDGHALTLRTSIIGRDLFSDVSLIDWFLSQRTKKVNGYTRSIFAGLTTEALSREIWRIISDYPRLHGLYHVSSTKISKFDLLNLVNRLFEAAVTIEAFDGVHCDRSLRSERYRQETGFVPPPWESMLAVMANDPTPYDRFRRAPT